MISRTEFENFNKKFEVVSAFVEHNGKILLLHRQDDRPQGNTWAVVAGKVKDKETLIDALTREIEEEVEIKLKDSDCKYFSKYYIRYLEYDFIFHVYHILLTQEPKIILNLKEHKDYVWITPQEALKRNLIQDEDQSIKWFYGL